MLNNKKLRIAALVLGASAAVMSAPSFAQRGGCWGDGPMGGRYAEGRHADRMKMHQQRLHDALKLTPQQEGAWTKFQESHPFAGNAKRPDPVDFSTLPTQYPYSLMLPQCTTEQVLLDRLAEGAPEGFAPLFQAIRKGLDTQNAAFESFTKVADQLGGIAEANLQAIKEAAVPAPKARSAAKSKVA